MPTGFSRLVTARENILIVALTLFAGRGYDAVGVAEICETDAITKPTLYHYFGEGRGSSQRSWRS